MYHSRIVLSVGGSVRYIDRNLRCTVTIDSVLANSKTERFLIHCARHFSSRLPPSGATCKYAKAPNTKKTLRYSLPIDMLLSAVSFLVVAQSSSEVPEGLMNNPVYHAKPILLFFFLKLISLLQILWGFLKNIWVHIVRTQN